MICHRCRSNAVAGTLADVPLCWSCLKSVKAMFAQPAARVAGWFDDLPGPYSAGEQAGQAVKSGDVPGPYSAGQAAGQSLKSSVPDAIASGAGAVKDITSTIKVLAVAGACFGGAFLIYSMWRAHQVQKEAIQVATAHPELFKAALVP